MNNLEKIVNDILQDKKLDGKLKEYNDVITLLDITDVSTDTKYQYVYSDFFVLRYLGTIRGKEFTPEQKQEQQKKFLDKYFSILQQEKSNKQMTMERAKQIYLRVCTIRNRAELSYASKIIHVIDNNFPIYDKDVCKKHFFSIYKKKGETAEEYRLRLWDMYVKYKNLFERYIKESEDAKTIIKILRKSDKFSSYKFSDVKLVDFVLWRDKKVLIKIPQEFRH
ncbi:MAG: hypothetical protein MJ165_01930 [Alphaproteobacteria bacterium]|nr:hypothetical protein [Alphaproteobacteria bacterium]